MQLRSSRSKTSLEPIPYVNTTQITTRRDDAEEVLKHAKADYIFKAAAVSDFIRQFTSDEKIKKQDGNMLIELRRTSDILAELKKIRKPDQIICGFSMETQNLLEL